VDKEISEPASAAVHQARTPLPLEGAVWHLPTKPSHSRLFARPEAGMLSRPPGAGEPGQRSFTDRLALYSSS
jgi:hypothetical protein